MPRKFSFPLQLRPEGRTAALMLSAIQAEGHTTRTLAGRMHESKNGTSVHAWLRDLIDVTLCCSFQDVFGIPIGQFLKRAKRLSDEELKLEAERLANLQFVALGGQQSAVRVDGDNRPRRRGRIPGKRHQ